MNQWIEARTRDASKRECIEKVDDADGDADTDYDDRIAYTFVYINYVYVLCSIKIVEKC